jgi:hypothetical protein
LKIVSAMAHTTAIAKKGATAYKDIYVQILSELIAIKRDRAICFCFFRSRFRTRAIKLTSRVMAVNAKAAVHNQDMNTGASLPAVIIPRVST